MTDLKCTVKQCMYNSDDMCSKGDIMVGGRHACCDQETSCSSFSARREGYDPMKSAVEHPSRTISVDCEANKCYYNSGYRCSAKHIDITGCSACNCGDTKCATFKAEN